MQFTDVFIRRPVLAIVISLLILLAGLRSLQILQVSQYPQSETAVVRIETIYPGASAELVEGFITTPLEREIASADGIGDRAEHWAGIHTLLQEERRGSGHCIARAFAWPWARRHRWKT